MQTAITRKQEWLYRFQTDFKTKLLEIKKNIFYNDKRVKLPGR